MNSESDILFIGSNGHIQWGPIAMGGDLAVSHSYFVPVKTTNRMLLLFFLPRFFLLSFNFSLISTFSSFL